MNGQHIEIRPPLAMRLYFTGFAVLWSAGLLTGVVQSVRHGTASNIPVFLGMIIFGCGLCYCMARIAVVARGDELLVRNLWRTRHIPRQAIEDFRAGTVFGQPGVRGIYALLRDGSVLSLDVSGMFGPAILRRDKARRAAQLAMLREWLHPATA